MTKSCPSCGGKGYKLTKTHKVAYTCGECGGSGEVELSADEVEILKLEKERTDTPKEKPSEADDYKLGLEHADRLWRDVIVSRIQELEASLDAINKSLNESWEQKPISVYVISELEKQYRERYYVLEVLRGLLEKKEVKTDG